MYFCIIVVCYAFNSDQYILVHWFYNTYHKCIVFRQSSNNIKYILSPFLTIWYVYGPKTTRYDRKNKRTIFSVEKTYQFFKTSITGEWTLKCQLHLNFPILLFRIQINDFYDISVDWTNTTNENSTTQLFFFPSVTTIDKMVTYDNKNVYKYL